MSDATYPLPLPFCTCGRYCPRHAYGDGILYMGCDECDTGLVYTTAREKPRRFALAVVERTIRLRAEVNSEQV